MSQSTRKEPAMFHDLSKHSVASRKRRDRSPTSSEKHSIRFFLARSYQMLDMSVLTLGHSSTGDKGNIKSQREKGTAFIVQDLPSTDIARSTKAYTCISTNKSLCPTC